MPGDTFGGRATESGGAGDRGDGPQTSPGSCSPTRKQWTQEMTPKDSLNSLNYLGIQGEVCSFLYYFFKPWLMDRSDRQQTHLSLRWPPLKCSSIFHLRALLTCIFVYDFSWDDRFIRIPHTLIDGVFTPIQFYLFLTSHDDVSLDSRTIVRHRVKTIWQRV